MKRYGKITRSYPRYVPSLQELESRTVLSPVPFVVQNNSGIADSQVYFAMYGKDPNFVVADNPSGFVYIDSAGASHSLTGTDPGGTQTPIPYIAETKLANAIDDQQLTITVTAATGFPTSYPAGAPTTPIRIGNEVMLVTGILPDSKGLTWNVARGQFGTSKLPHVSGAVVKWDVQHVPDFTLSMLPTNLNGHRYVNLTDSTTLHSGRLLMGMKSKVFAPLTTDAVGGVAGGNVTGVAPPAAGSSTDLNNKSYYDFFELDLAGGAINGNTTQIDQFGIPYKLEFTPSDPNNPNGVGVIATRHDVITSFKAFVSGTPFEACWKQVPAGENGIFRILSPASVLELRPDNPLHTYFNSYADQFFQMYSQAQQFVNLTVTSVPGVPTRTYRGNVINDGSNWVFRFIQHGTDSGGGSDSNHYKVYYPFFTDNSASYAGYTPLLSTAAAPSWLSGTTASPSEMVFAAHQVFADNTSQFPSDVTASTILGNIENQLVAALNRGVALSTPDTWHDSNTFYQNSTYNWYSHFFHRSAISIDKKAYGFPYDDQGGESSDFAVNGLTQLTITFGAWGPSTKTQLFGVGGANGQVQIYRSDTNTVWDQFAPYGAAYTGGVAVAWGDVNGDGFDELITAAARGNPHVIVFNGRDIENGDFDPANLSGSVLASWMAFGEGLNLGANVAVGDVDNDGFADIAAAANTGNAHVRLYNGLDIAHGTFDPIGASLQAEWFAYGLQFNVGANVAIGDVSGDWFADVITGATAGNPHVKVYDGEAFADGSFDPANPDASVLWQRFVYELQVDIGVYLTVGDTNGDGKLDVITGASTGNPSVRAYGGESGNLLDEFFAFDVDQNIGVSVGAAHVGTQAAIFTASTHGTAMYKAFDPLTGAEIFQGVPAGFPTGGIYIAA